MNSFFFYKLFRHSKFAFLCVIIFVVAYLISFSKKMDMALFPYNNMYSSVQSKNIKCYYLKINGHRIHYTHFMYWKKDFLEQSITKYASYVKENHKNYLNIFIGEKIKSDHLKSATESVLSPGNVDFKNWSNWIVSYANYKADTGDYFELIEYKLIIKNGIPVVSDSLILVSTKIKNEYPHN